ncbi:MAG: NlpC/P60 family protein [Paenibacillaceae bacterium]
MTTQSQFIKTNDFNSDKPKQLISGTSKSIIDAGMKYLGTPYVFGSSRSNTQSFDCSDFVRQAFKDGAGVILPGNSRTQADYVKKIGNTTTNWRNLKPGDIMFFISYKGSKSSNYTSLNKSGQRITHNGIYLGNGKILQTYSKESGGVRIDIIEGKHWEYRFAFGGSAIK